MEKLSLDTLYNWKDLKWGEMIEIPNTRKMLNFGNLIYNRYPARSSFFVFRSIINAYSEANSELNILDPFMGSGTTAIEASLFNHNVYGTEMDPFARMISEVSIKRLDKSEKKIIDNEIVSIVNNFENYSVDHSLMPNLKNITYWFDKDVFIDLLKLKSYIYNEYENWYLLDYLKLIFADCIKPSSLLERQSTKPYISSKYKKVVKPVKDSFLYSSAKHISASMEYNVLSNSDKYIKGINWLGYDATTFKADSLIDLAITSPPYLNAFDYTSIIKIDSSWVGTLIDSDIEKLRKVQVGHAKRKDNIIDPIIDYIFKNDFNLLLNSPKSKRTTNQNIANTCLSYFNDMYMNLKCVYKSLKTGGQYHIIVGDNIVNKVNIETHRIIADIAVSVGYKWIGYYCYPIKNHRTSIPRNGRGGKIDVEYVLILEK